MFGPQLRTVCTACARRESNSHSPIKSRQRYHYATGAGAPGYVPVVGADNRARTCGLPVPNRALFPLSYIHLPTTAPGPVPCGAVVVVWVAGFEPATSRSRSGRGTKLHYTQLSQPRLHRLCNGPLRKCCTPG